MPNMTCDLLDGQQPISVNLSADDCDRMTKFMAKVSHDKKEIERLTDKIFTPFDEPSDDAFDDYAQAIITLISMARQDCGGSEVCAQVLLGLYNANFWHVDLVGIACRLDHKHTNAALTAIKLRGELMTEPHNVIENGDAVFGELWKRWEHLHIENRYKKHYRK